MSGLIYNQKVTSDLTPDAPDATPQKVVQQGVQNIQDIAQQQKEFDFKVKVKEAQYLANTVKNEALSIYDSATKAHGNDITKWNEFVNNNIKGIYEKIPDDKYRAKLMAEIQIATTSTRSAVQKNTIDLFNKKNNQMEVDATMRTLDGSIVALSSIFNATDKNLSPIQRKETVQQFQDGMMLITNAYNSKDALDDNGNPKYSASEKARIVDAYENAGVYAIIEYAGQNVGTNRKGVENTRDYLKNNRTQIMKDYGMKAEKYDKALKYMDDILKGETKTENIKTEVMLELDINNLGITKSDGQFTVNTETKKVDVLDTINKVEQAYSQKLITDASYKSKIVKLKSAYWDMEAKPLFEKKSTGIGGFFKQDTVGTTMMADVENIFKEFDSEDNRVKSAKFDVIRQIYNIMQSQGIDPEGQDVFAYSTMKDKYIPTIYRTVFPNAKGLTDEQLRSPEVQDMIEKQYIGNITYDKIVTKVGLTNKSSSIEKIISKNEKKVSGGVSGGL